jgi:hypothetical protein
MQGIEVLSSVDFYDQRMLMTIEVDYVWAECLLTSELHPAQGLPPQMMP